jgi:hypothetical protein
MSMGSRASIKGAKIGWKGDQKKEEQSKSKHQKGKKDGGSEKGEHSEIHGN